MPFPTALSALLSTAYLCQWTEKIELACPDHKDPPQQLIQTLDRDYAALPGDTQKFLKEYDMKFEHDLAEYTNQNTQCVGWERAGSGFARKVQYDLAQIFCVKDPETWCQESGEDAVALSPLCLGVGRGLADSPEGQIKIQTLSVNLCAEHSLLFKFVRASLDKFSSQSCAETDENNQNVNANPQAAFAKVVKQFMHKMRWKNDRLDNEILKKLWK